MYDSTCRSAREAELLTLVGVRDQNAPIGVQVSVDDLLISLPGDVEFRDAEVDQLIEDVVQQWSTGDFDQGFRFVLGQGSESRSIPRREDDRFYRIHS